MSRAVEALNVGAAVTIEKCARQPDEYAAQHIIDGNVQDAVHAATARAIGIVTYDALSVATHDATLAAVWGT